VSGTDLAEVRHRAAAAAALLRGDAPERTSAGIDTIEEQV